MFKILFVEDEPTSIETLIEDITGEIEGVLYKISPFEQANSFISGFLPDVVVLDIFRGSAVPDGDAEGLANFQFIWDDWFCPVVIYSARPDDVSEKIQDHPFVNSVQKGRDSESKVINCIQQFKPHIDALNEIQIDIRRHANRELQHTAHRVFSQIAEEERSAVLARVVRRRIAAMMDAPPDKPIASWEQYLYPPSGENLLTGDIIRLDEKDMADPEGYRVILTPSCDLVRGNGRTPNVEEVLVARCTDISKMLPEIGCKTDTGRSKLESRLPRFLHRAYGDFCLPLPALPGILPVMTVQLKNLELIDLNRIGNNDENEYVRVVSVDSPFREMIAWAYLQVTGRPGLPERDFETWVNEICEAVNEPDAEGGQGD